MANLAQTLKSEIARLARTRSGRAARFILHCADHGGAAVEASLDVARARVALTVRAHHDQSSVPSTFASRR